MVVNYLVNISLAAIGANIIASAIVVSAEHAAQHKDKDEEKKLKSLEKRLDYYELQKKETEPQSQEEKIIINKIVETKEEIYAVKKRLGVDR